MKKYLLFPFVIVSSFLSAQTGVQPDIEIIESIPAGTTLENPDIRNASDVWIEMFDRAGKSIDLEQFYISNEPGKLLEPVLAALYRAADRGVVIRVIVDARMYSTYPQTVDSLEAYPNIETRKIDFGKIAGGIQHSKYFIVDSKEIFVGSQNFDWRALEHIHELGLRIANAEIASSYQSVFTYDWNAAAGTLPPIPVPPNPGSTAAVHDGPETVASISPTFSPKGFIPDSTLWDEAAILRVINRSRKTLTLQFLGYSTAERRGGSYTVIDNALRAAAARGVDVKLIVADWEKGSSGVNGLQELSALPNIHTAFSVIPEWEGGYIPFARVEHCKYIVADERTFWLGTSNCEKNYFYNTRNLGITGESSIIGKRLNAVFLKSWNSPYMEMITPQGIYQKREHGEKK